MQITKDVIEEFAADNVKYLELRTTPRDVPATGMTKETYIASVIKAIKDTSQPDLDITVRLLLAIDRGQHSADDAQQVVELADSFRQRTGAVIVGIDLSGDPSVSDSLRFVKTLFGN